LPLIIPIFVMNRGGPHRCVFCNIRKTAGSHPERISENAFRDTVQQHLRNMKRGPDRIQIAFYGGNFTGMEMDDQIELLEYAGLFIKQGLVNNIRISTRPDCLDPECLGMLKAYNVTTIEIGVQSMVDEVLNLANRGHSSADVVHSMNMLQEWDFETGIHLMAGLPGDSRASFEYTVEKTIALQPDSVRIHPTLVLQDTDLAKSYLNGDYVPLRLAEAIDLCKLALRRFEETGIPVIRLGLQTTQEMEAPGSIVAGPFHPSFRSLVEGSLYFDMAAYLLADEEVKEKYIEFSLSPKDISFFRGQRNVNIHTLKKIYGIAGITVSADPEQKRGSLAMVVDDRKSTIDRFNHDGLVKI
jgi:histone acetyltransferase (RNA polymerase elongator complex component)